MNVHECSLTIWFMNYLSLWSFMKYPVMKNKICLKSSNTEFCWDLNFKNHIHFQSLEVVCRGSETQLQVAENLN